MPRPGTASLPGSGAPGPLVVAGMFRTGNGIGRAARYCYDALSAQGLSPLAADTSLLLNQAETPASVPLDRVPLHRYGTLILFANPPEIERCLFALGLRRWHDWRIIGAWAWETPIAPAPWKRQTAYVSEIWSPSRFCSEAFSAAYDRPVKTVPHCIPERRQVGDGCQAGNADLSILTVADAHSSLERKNPLGAVNMFRTAFPHARDVRLTIKCRNLSVFPDYASRLRDAIGADPRISLVEGTLTDQQHEALIMGADILLSPHRSEGFGLNLAEAMSLGKCVVATAWSGNLEYMSQETAALIPCVTVPVHDTTGVYPSVKGDHWAEPDIQEGAGLLRQLAASPQRRMALGKAARLSLRHTLKPEAYLNALGWDCVSGTAESYPPGSG